MANASASRPMSLAPTREQTPPRFPMPAGAIDTHAHVIGAFGESALSPERSYDAPAAPLTAYLAMLDATGFASGVLVQVSIHGTDNSLMLQALRRAPQRLRGVAVVAPDIAEQDCASMRQAGVRGLRINTLFGGGMSLRDLRHYDGLCTELGWHLQLLIDGRTLPELMPQLAPLKSPLVFDHLGMLPAVDGPDSRAAQALRSLLADGAWVKLSGAYRISGVEAPYRDTIDLARSLIEAAPERCVFGSDWPHVAMPTPIPPVGRLLDLFADWAPEPALRTRILVDNPKRLYGF